MVATFSYGIEVTWPVLKKKKTAASECNSKLKTTITRKIYWQIKKKY